MAIAAGLLVLLAFAAPIGAAEPMEQTLNAPINQVWSTTVAVLKQLGWEIEKEDHSIGWITTASRTVDGENYGVYAKGIRHRLTLRIKAVDAGRTTVSVERAVFKRERILWLDNDETLTVKERDVEKSLLSAIEKSL